MRKWLAIAGVALCLLGCRLPPDRDDLKLLDDRQPLPDYAELYLRSRSQASLALEAFYADDWNELEASAKALEQTARFLPKSRDVPAPLAGGLTKDSGQLQADAVLLGEAARAKNVRAANEVLQRIQFNVRALRPRLAPD